MSSIKPEWKEKQTITLEKYFNLRFADASKYARLLVEQLGKEKAYEILAKNALVEGKDYGKDLLAS
jgi:hypothetical protein